MLPLTRQQYGPAVAVLAAGAFAARTLTLTDQSLWLDEVDAIAFAAQQVQDLLAMMASPAQNGALYYLLLKGWFGLTGSSEFTLRYASVLPSVLAIPLLFALGRRLLSPEAGFWAAFLAATSPYLFFYAQEGKMYGLYVCLTILAMYLFLAALEQGGVRRWAAYLGVTVVGLYVHLFFVFLLVAQHAIVPLLCRRAERGRRGWYAAQAVLLLPALPFALWEAPAAVWGYSTALAHQPFETMVRVLVLRFTLHTETWPSPFVLLPFAIAACAGLVLRQTVVPPPVPLKLPALRDDALLDGGIEPARPGVGSSRGPAPRGRRPAAHRGGRMVVVAWLVAPVLAYALVSVNVPAFMHRYLTLVVPAYYLLLAGGLAALRSRWPLAGVLCAAGILGSWGAVILRPAEVRPDFRSAAAFVAAGALPDDGALFVAGYGARAIAFYAPDHPRELVPPYTNEGLPAAEVAASLQAQTAPYRRVWLVLFEDWLWDGSQLTRSWLDLHGTVVASATFPGVTVIGYRLDG